MRIIFRKCCGNDHSLFCRNIVMSGDGNLFFASIGVNPGKSTTICDVAGLDSGIVIVNSCELYYQKPDKYQEHQKIVKSDLDFAYFIVFFCQNRDSLSTILVYLKILYDVSVKSEFCHSLLYQDCYIAMQFTHTL